MQKRSVWIAAKDDLWLRYDGPVPKERLLAGAAGCCRPYQHWAAAQLRAGIAERRRLVAGDAALKDRKLLLSAADLACARHAAVSNAAPASISGG